MNPSYQLSSPSAVMLQRTFNLDQTLLWRTLSFIADPGTLDEWDTEFPVAEIPAPLITLRLASQVCSSWRDLVLCSSSWWARNIHLDHLKQKSGHWRNEVLARSGISALHVIGVFEVCHARFLEVLLEDHWARIRVLHLISKENILGYLHFDLYLQRPTPSLEVFVVHHIIDFEDFEEPSRQNFQLFANSAPSLRCLHPFFREVEAFIRAPFILQLRKLNLSASTINPHQLLDALGGAHALEELRNVRVTATTEAGTTRAFKLPAITLPRLRQISVHAFHVDAWLDVLSNITPAPQCTLNTALEHDGRYIRPLTAEDIISISHILSSYSGQHTSSEGSTAVRLHLGKYKFSFRHERGSLLTDISSFFLKTVKPLPPHTSSTLLKSLAAYDLKPALSLDLEIAEGCDLDPADPIFTEFTTSTLSSVQVLTVDIPTIQFFLTLDRLPATIAAHTDILPSLRILRYPYEIPDDQAQLLTTFISWRQKIGRPISFLDITPVSEYQNDRRDFRFLEQTTGLRVVWTVRHSSTSKVTMEYLCGSANADVLIL
ncbi:hypothetical protein GALMADRAFT_145460 [Galerina marginata CBS 339.88]|uniref:F-box domain-containing protein n=1 Tax=Galerina marginata (strain CBS 339.88) TaxID=685588 RepID=A0A067SP00_GALM3|nr:hypothetical protein GALMADRAFT_145460 [Galerina marginata CBS 339.88]